MAATTWAGFDLAAKFKQRPQQIRQWKNAIQMIEAEMVYGQSSLREVCETIQKQLPQPIARFFAELIADYGKKTDDFSQLWEDHIHLHWKQNALDQNEKEILIQFGNTLGQHDLIHQQKQIRLTLSHLERELEDAVTMFHQYHQMARGLGVLSGLLVIILII
nr:stage III sporulation protein SpoIIIAB [Thalassobacillus sp. CUG 92003]